MKLDAMPIEIKALQEVFPDERKAAFDAISTLYGTDTEAVINCLIDMTVRAAVLAGFLTSTLQPG